MAFLRNFLSKYDKNGFDRQGFDREGYDREGFDREGFDKEGFDKEGFNRKGRDKNGYDRDGFNKRGFNAEGFTRRGYDREGFDRDGYDRNGYDKNGYDRKGFDKEGFNRKGRDKNGYDREGFNAEGFSRQGYNIEGFDRGGFDRQGYNIEGFDKNGFDRQGYDRKGYSKVNPNGVEGAFSQWMISNAIYIGVCEHFEKMLPESKPNLKSTFKMSINGLLPLYEELNMETSVGKAIPVSYPAPDYSPSVSILMNRNMGGGLYAYISDMGAIVLEHYGIEARRNLEFKDMCQILGSVAVTAWLDTLRLLKESMVASNSEITTHLMDEYGYLSRLMFTKEILSVSLNSILRPDEMLFISDEFADENGCATTFYLSEFDFDNPNMLPWFPELTIIALDNQNGDIRSGAAEIAFKKGKLYKNTDTYLGDYLDQAVRKIVRNIKL